MEKGVTSQGMQVATEAGKGKEMDLPTYFQKELKSHNTLILAQWNWSPELWDNKSMLFYKPLYLW